MKPLPDIAKVLYLDFDGVLHDGEVYFHPRRGIYIATAGRTLFEWMPILERLLAPHPDVGIVLSTSWVRVRSFQYAKKRLSPALQTRVVGATFHSDMWEEGFSHKPRGVQIAEDVQRRRPQSWFAIDDDHHGWPSGYRDNLVRTASAYGISEPRVQAAIQAKLAAL